MWPFRRQTEAERDAHNARVMWLLKNAEIKRYKAERDRRGMSAETCPVCSGHGVIRVVAEHV